MADVIREALSVLVALFVYDGINALILHKHAKATKEDRA